MSRYQDAERSYSIETDNKCFESVGLLKYFRTALTNQNFIHEEIKSRLKLRNAC